jgi:hypothetical protein
MRADSLHIRLVGAPGDSDADSVTYRGRFDTELYAGTVFAGELRGPSTALTGPLTIYRRGLP